MRARSFSELDFELAQRFADAATLAIENARTRADLRELARHDELTGILNRRAFNAQLAETVAELPSHLIAALVLVDLDDFKSVNDIHGHLAGDEVLRAVAARLEQAAGGHPVFRLGGDEFAALVTGSPLETDAAVTRIATQLRSFDVPDPGRRARAERQHRHREGGRRHGAAGEPAARGRPRDVPGEAARARARRPPPRHASLGSSPSSSARAARSSSSAAPSSTG